MQILENISLRPYNTFGVDVKGRYFAEVFTEEELLNLVHSLEQQKKPYLLLGGGSNLLFTKDFDGTVIKISTKGFVIIRETDDEIDMHVQAGENWDEFVKFCVENGWGGLENLSLIPGNVGTGPVQNIGAYGTEIRETLLEVHVYDRIDHSKKIIPNSDCEFSYRYSIFKKFPNRFIILGVTFRLRKKPILNIQYKDIKEELTTIGIISPDIQSVREAVCRIRRRKLPDPVEIGNSGSFFKNPVVDLATFSSLAKKFPGIVSYPQGDSVKLAAAWMIQQAGWKGFRKGDAGVHPDQPLVLVNYGTATGLEILALAKSIQADVLEKYGIVLETEVNVL